MIYWIQRIVKWIYIQADHIPLRIQIGVDRNYTAIQDAEWQVKNDQADEKVKAFLAKEFPTFYKKKHLDPYEEGSELREENMSIMNRVGKEPSEPSNKLNLMSELSIGSGLLARGKKLLTS